jgi:hypothetical protein
MPLTGHDRISRVRASASAVLAEPSRPVLGRRCSVAESLAQVFRETGARSGGRNAQ